MVGVEFDMIVEDSLVALKLYQEVFGVACVEAQLCKEEKTRWYLLCMGSDSIC